MFGDVEMMQSYVYGWEREGGEGRGGRGGGRGLSLVVLGGLMLDGLLCLFCSA